LQYGGIDKNTQKIKTLRVDSNTQNPTLTLAPNDENKNLQPPIKLRWSFENRRDEASVLHRYDEASDMPGASGIDGTERWSQQIIAKFDRDGMEPCVPLGDAQLAPT